MELTYQDGFDDARNGLCKRHFVHKTMPGGDRILQAAFVMTLTAGSMGDVARADRR